MKKAREIVNFLYAHHFVRYLFVGGTTFMIDFGLLVLLHGKLHVNLAIAASLAYWSSILYNFTLNRSWTFSIGEKKNLRKHITAYVILLGFNYFFTVSFVTIVGQKVSYIFAKVFAVLIQVSWTYFVYKNIIFIPSPPENLS